MMYRLIARGEQGGMVCFVANTMSECIDKFDAQYERSGFKISIVDNLNGGTLRIVKRTFR